jgi:hypothetical protein
MRASRSPASIGPHPLKGVAGDHELFAVRARRAGVPGS